MKASERRRRLCRGRGINREFCGRTGTEYLECRPFFTEARAMLGRRVGLYTRIAMRVVDRDMRAKMIRLRLRG